MRSYLGLCGLLLALGCSASTTTTTTTTGAATTGTSGGQTVSTDSSVVFRNHSRWAIFHIYLSPVSQTTWGPDQLGAHVLRSGEDYTLHSIPCENYDLKLVDQDGDECILHNVGICAEDSGWTIDDNDLVSCQAFTAAAGAH
jgi:hypothetical protein